MGLTKKQKVLLFKNLIRADHFDKMMYRRVLTGKLIGFYHPAEGGIAPGVGAATFLKEDDIMSPHGRGHGQSHMLSKGIDLKYYLAEHTGKQTGCCQGRSTFHWSFPKQGVHMASGLIGYNFAPATGWAWACKRRGQGQVVMNCSGDGSYGQGRAHEAMLMAMNWKLPIIFWCENNSMAIHSNISEMHPTDDIASLARGYDMPSKIVDGQDVFACAEVALAAIKHARAGKGPFFVEAKTVRLKEHDVGTPNLDGYRERTEQELAKLRERDPVVLATQRVLEEKILTQKQIDQIYTDAEREVEEAEQFADGSPIAKPELEKMVMSVYAP